MRDKWSKSRDEAAKREEELIVVKALLKTKEVALYGAQEVSQILCTLSLCLKITQKVSFQLLGFFLRVTTRHGSALHSAVQCRAAPSPNQNKKSKHVQILSNVAENETFLNGFQTLCNNLLL